jgi:ribonuclease HI
MQKKDSYKKCLCNPTRYDDQEECTVFTDGSWATHNGKKLGGIGVYFGKNDSRNVSRIMRKNEGIHTNNRAELLAIKDALLNFKNLTKKYIIICSDSKYCIGVLTLDYEAKKNQDIIEPMIDLIWEIINNGNGIQFHYIPSHTTAPRINSEEFYYWNGNNEADILATNAGKSNKVE